MIAGKRNKDLGNKNSLGTSRFVQWQKSVSRWKNTTLDVDGDTDRFVCAYLYGKFIGALDKRAAQGESIWDEWKSSCDR